MLLMWGLSSSALAKIRIYGGPVSSAGSGRYYPPGGLFAGGQDALQWVNGNYPGYPGTYRRPATRLDLNPLFVPGTVFGPPGYVPRYYPRSAYFAYDYIGYRFGSAMDR